MTASDVARQVGGRTPGRAAYVALLTTSTLGTLSSTVMSAPINDITAELRASPQETVLAVSAFTVAMVVFAPLAGWLSERLGMTRFLVGSLLLMVAGQAGAAVAPGIGVLVAMRAVQGIACSGIPPAIQKGLSDFWPDRRARSMAAWASAIGIGQAVGPLVGGVVSEFFGWRALFGLYAVVCLGVLAVVVRYVPWVPAGHPALETGPMAQLLGGAGLLIVGLTWAGQGGAPLTCAALILPGVAVLCWALRTRRDGSHLLGDALRDRAYVVATVAAGAGMCGLGITMVGLPLYLGRDLGLGAGLIGAVVFAVAIGMSVFGPIASRLSGRYGAEPTLAGGLVLLLGCAVAMAVLEATVHGTVVLVPMVVVLLLIGCGVATVQSMAALVLLGGRPRAGLALGVHNMGRFGGLALGYAWVAGCYALGLPVLVHAGLALVAGAAALTLLWRRPGRL
ncbi:MFS transporter [Nocardioides insulae]|uniref:MFS transporter n=1 Tax=Nocardioides insulae TaxID=394734 RepID=UPI0003FADC6F|nr:MFS transporter [Nocardioides insulae]